MNKYKLLKSINGAEAGTEFEYNMTFDEKINYTSTPSKESCVELIELIGLDNDYFEKIQEKVKEEDKSLEILKKEHKILFDEYTNNREAKMNKEDNSLWVTTV